MFDLCPVGGEQLSQAGLGVFGHLCVSLIKWCLLAFVALRPLTTLRGDLFETGL